MCACFFYCLNISRPVPLQYSLNFTFSKTTLYRQNDTGKARFYKHFINNFLMFFCLCAFFMFNHYLKDSNSICFPTRIIYPRNKNIKQWHCLVHFVFQMHMYIMFLHRQQNECRERKVICPQYCEFKCELSNQNGSDDM